MLNFCDFIQVLYLPEITTLSQVYINKTSVSLTLKKFEKQIGHLDGN